ncbi:MAG: hypothetical protein ACR2QU_07965, partial [Gammaproteobacteria bacterium]
LHTGIRAARPGIEGTTMKSKTQLVITVLVYALAILSAAAGVPKIQQMPQELDFLGRIGISHTGVLVLGVLQLSGGLLILWKKSRLTGAAIAGLMFLVSSIAIFAGGNMSFGLISLLPVAVSVVVIINLRKGVGRSDA